MHWHFLGFSSSGFFTTTCNVETSSVKLCDKLAQTIGSIKTTPATKKLTRQQVFLNQKTTVLCKNEIRY